MKKIVWLLVVIIGIVYIGHADIKVVAVQGEVYVRHNVQEQWVRVTVGDMLKPDDSMKSEKKSSATILVDGKSKYTVPELVIIDFSDLRMLTPEELLLKLAMERVRSVPAHQSGDEFQIPRTTIVHGAHQGQASASSFSDPAIGKLRLNGTKLLFNQGFYATCVLKTKEIFRVHPDLLKMTDARMIVASALEKMKLEGEALSEYTSLSEEPLPVQQRAIVEEKIAVLAKKQKQ